MPPFTIDDTNRLALSYLLAREGVGKEYWRQRDDLALTLFEHPFGLDTKMPDPKDGYQPCADTFLVASPAGTEESVQAMLLMLHEHLRHYHPENRRSFRLRVIRAQIAEDWHNAGKYVHNVYFELITGAGTLLCGGCTDCSGEGGRGRERLEAVFNFVAALFDVPVEEAVIPLARAGPAEKKLNAAYSAFEMAKAQSAES